MEYFNLDIDLDLNLGEISLDKRIHKPKKIRSFRDRQICYREADEMAKNINIGKGERYFSFIPGNFIFGDLIEAFCVEKNLHIKEMTISTLSIGEENVDSLKNLLDGDFVDKLNLLVSDYFYSHEKFGIIKYCYEELDQDNKFQLSVARSHSKTCIFETYDGMKFVFHGSANLRSSDNIEQIDLEENEQLYDYIYEFHSKIAKEYSTINKSIKSKQLWQILDEVDQAEGNQENPQQKNELQNGRVNNPTF